MRERLGKFVVSKLLGKGSMGEVYLGRDPSLGREVALKVISTGSTFGEEAQARFEREARAVALLNHPNIVTVYEFGEDEGLRYLAMEYVHGEELEALIQRGKLSKAELLKVLVQVCEGLAYAHDQGVVHRDIKPANILVTRHGKRSHAKVMDFGVAQMGVPGLTEAGVRVGTVSYMAPEYLDQGTAGAASDLFALGVILYEVLTGGRKPFPGGSNASILSRILLHPPDPLRPSDLEGVPRSLAPLVLRTLSKRPEDRPADAEDLASCLRAVLREWPDAPAVPDRSEDISQKIRVGKGVQAHCLSLKVALRQARAGSEILLLPGVYRESVTVDKDVEILGVGEPGEVVLEGVGGPALVMAAGATVLRGVTLKGAPGQPALLVQRGSSVVEGCTLAGPGTCAEVATGAQVTLRDCRILATGPRGLAVAAQAQARLEGGSIEGFLEAGIQVEAGGQVTLQAMQVGPGPGTGLRLGARGQATLEGSTLSGAAGAVELGRESRGQFTRCRLVDSRYAGLLALEQSQATLEDCELSGNGCAGAHVLAGANVVLRQCQVSGNEGFGLSVMDRGLATLEGCQVRTNGGSGLLIHRGATVQVRSTTFAEGRSLGIDCADGGQGVLDGCEILGNAGVGVQVESGGSLLLVRCTLRDGRDSGLLLLEDSQVTLEECVVHRNARGGILLARDAADPILRGGNRIEDGFQRVDGQGHLARVIPLPGS